MKKHNQFELLDINICYTYIFSTLIVQDIIGFKYVYYRIYKYSLLIS